MNVKTLLRVVGTIERKNLTEGYWYKYPGKQNYYELRTAELPAKTTVDVIVKVTKGEVEVFGGPDDKPDETFDQTNTILEGSKKTIQFTLSEKSRMYIGIKRVTKGAICQVKYVVVGTIIPYASNTITTFSSAF